VKSKGLGTFPTFWVRGVTDYKEFTYISESIFEGLGCFEDKH